MVYFCQAKDMDSFISIASTLTINKRIHIMNTFTAIALCLIIGLLIKHQYDSSRPATWSGGVFLVMEDDSMIKLNSDNDKCNKKACVTLPASAVIKGVYLFEAKNRFLSSIHIEIGNITSKGYLSECPKDNPIIMENNDGLYQLYPQPINVEGETQIWISVYYSQPFNGSKTDRSGEVYYADYHIGIKQEETSTTT